MNINTHLTLNDGHTIPQLGLGVFRAKDGEGTYQAVLHALKTGYRHIDTAAIYGNEASVGRAIADSGIKRDDIFVTTKLWNDDTRAGKAREGLEGSLRRLGLDRVDLYLIHWPAEGYLKAWKDLVHLRNEGLCTSIGVSNFNIHHLKDLFAASVVVPAVNQIENHPYLAQLDLKSFCEAHGILIEAWSPLGGQNSNGSLLNNEIITAIAKKHGVSSAQILIRWQLERGVIVIPKSVHAERIESNADLYGFALDEEDQRMIATLNDGQRFGSDPDHFNF